MLYSAKDLGIINENKGEQHGAGNKNKSNSRRICDSDDIHDCMDVYDWPGGFNLGERDEIR